MNKGQEGNHNASGDNSKVLHVEGGAHDVRADTHVNIMQVAAAVEKRDPEEELFLAVKRGDTDTIENLLTRGVGTVNSAHKDGSTLLHEAARHKQIGVVKALLKRRANIRAVCRTGGFIPLHVAVQEADLAVVKALLSHGFQNHQITAESEDGSTALHMAVQENCPEVVEALLEAEADVNAVRKDDGYTPLRVVAAHGHSEVIKVLLRHDARVDAAFRKYNCIAKAEQEVAEERAQAEAQAKAEQERQVEAAAKDQAKTEAIEKKAVEQVEKRYASHQPKAQAPDPALAEQAKEKAEQEKQEMQEQMKTLRAEKAQAEKDKAAAEKKAELAEKAQAEGGGKAKAEQEGKAKAAAEAAQKQQAEAATKVKAQAEAAEKERAPFAMEIQKKAQAKAAAAQKNPKLQDALIKACEEGDTAQVKQLLRQGASPTAPDRKNKKPLGAAVWGMNTEVVDTLLEEMKDEFPMTWEECKAHNQQHYREVFMFSDFALKTYKEWYELLLKMSRSPYLRALHLAEADKVWHDPDTSSWEKFFSYVGGERGQMVLGIGQGIVANSRAVFVGLNKGMEDSINRAVPAQKLAR